MSSLPSERIAVAATVDPIDGNATTIKTDAIDMQDFAEAMFILLAGVLASSGTITAIAVQESATTTDGDFGAMSPTKTGTSWGDTSDAKQKVFNVKAEELSTGKRYVRLVATVSAHSQLVAAVGLGLKPKYGPATDYDLSTVDEVVG